MPNAWVEQPHAKHRGTYRNRQSRRLPARVLPFVRPLHVGGIWQNDFHLRGQPCGTIKVLELVGPALGVLVPQLPAADVEPPRLASTHLESPVVGTPQDQR